MSTLTLTPKQAVLQALEQGCRVPELEPIIVQNPIAACFYAKNVVKARWPEGEEIIATGLRSRIVDFNTLDCAKDPNRYRPVGTGHVKDGNNYRLMIVYMGLAKCRVPAFEAKLATDRWKGNTYDYCKLIYRYTGELIDIDCPEVCSWMIRDLCFNKVSKKINRVERIRVCKELHKRMILHSFAQGDNYEVRSYFAALKKSENHFLVMLSQYDDNDTVVDIMRKMDAAES